MRFLFEAGLLLIALQAVLHVGHGQSRNPDDNKTIQDGVPSTPVLTDAPSITQEHSRATAYNVAKQSHDLQVSGGKVKATTVSEEGSVSERHATSSSEIKATEMSISEMKTNNGVSEQVVKVTDETKHSAEPNVTVDQTMTNKTETETATDKPTEHKTNNFVFPDPIEQYSNTIMLEGHIFGIRDDVMSMIHAALSAGDIFVPVDPLTVYPLTNSFEEMSYEGDKVTHIRYVVSYNGKPIHTEIITRLMSHPKVQHHFKKQLEGRHLRQYKEAKPIQNKSWIHQHFAVVVVPSCVVFVLIILALVIVVAKKRSSAASKLEKKRAPTSSAKLEKKCPPPPYSVENPAYDFETSYVMEGHTLP